jgi:hypothetical protein
MGQDTYCDVGVFVEFPFNKDRFRQMLDAGIEHFYVYIETQDQYADEAVEFGTEEEFMDVIRHHNHHLVLEPMERDDDNEDGHMLKTFILHCFIPCVKSDVHALSRRSHPIAFTYNGQETVDSVIENFRQAKEKFRSLGFSEESIMIGNNFMDSY